MSGSSQKKKNLHETTPIMAKKLAEKQYKSLQEEVKFLKARWKALKDEEDNDDKDFEKSFIATRWKTLQQEEKKLKSILDTKQAKKDSSNVDSFAKKFTKNLKGVKEVYTFLKSMEDEKYYHSEDMRLKSYHYGCKMGEMIADLLGNKKDATGMESLHKLLLTTKDFPEMNKQDGEVNVTDPNSPSKYTPGDELQQWGDGGSLTKKGKKDFPEMSKQDGEVNVTDPSNPAKIAKLGEDDKHNPFHSGNPGSREAGHLIPGVKCFEEADEEHARINLTDPEGPSHYNPGQEAMQQFGQGGSLVKFLKSVADAGFFLKSLAYEKAFGIGHLDTARRFVKALEKAAKAADMGKPFAEENSEFPGDLGNLLQEGDEPEHKKKAMEEEKEEELDEKKEDKAIGGGMGDPMMDDPMGGGDPMMGGGGMGELDDGMDDDKFGAVMGKSLEVINRNTLKQSQDIANLLQSVNNLNSMFN